MARTISRDALEQKISKLETAISKNRQQYDQLTKELKDLLDKKKALQSEELMKAIAESSRSYEDILRYIVSVKSCACRKSGHLVTPYAFFINYVHKT